MVFVFADIADKVSLARISTLPQHMPHRLAKPLAE